MVNCLYCSCTNWGEDVIQGLSLAFWWNWLLCRNYNLRVTNTCFNCYNDSIFSWEVKIFFISQKKWIFWLIIPPKSRLELISSIINKNQVFCHLSSTEAIIAIRKVGDNPHHIGCMVDLPHSIHMLDSVLKGKKTIKWCWIFQVYSHSYTYINRWWNYFKKLSRLI